MQHLTTQHIVDILNQLGPVFNAHAAEKKALGMSRFGGTGTCKVQRHHKYHFTSSVHVRFSNDRPSFSVLSPRVHKSKKRKVEKRGMEKLRSENLAEDT